LGVARAFDSHVTAGFLTNESPSRKLFSSAWRCAARSAFDVCFLIKFDFEVMFKLKF
jgi:hypothetical protein